MNPNRLLGLCGLVLLVGLLQAEEGKKTKSALETDATGWLDLFPGQDLAGWKRVPLDDKPLADKNPWKADQTKKILNCDGVGLKEMLLYDKEQFGDGIFHVEWRFAPSDKEDYNSGIYVRTSGDGKIWHQAQVAHTKKPPNMGDLFGDVLKDGKTERVIVPGTGHKLVHPPGGDWNTYEITCKGTDITVWINGEVATKWDACETPKGHVGVQCEFFVIDFRNLKFKPSK